MVEDPEYFDPTTQDKMKTGLELLTRKGVYPYEWMDDEDKLYTTSLPDTEAFHSELYNEDISDEEYAHALRVWDHFQCEAFEDYHNLYLTTDVILLQDVFERLRKTCMKYYQLDAARYLTAPSLAWDAMLLYTGVELELLTEDRNDIYILMRTIFMTMPFLAHMSGGHIMLTREEIDSIDWNKEFNRDMEEIHSANR